MPEIPIPLGLEDVNSVFRTHYIHYVVYPTPALSFFLFSSVLLTDTSYYQVHFPPWDRDGHEETGIWCMVGWEVSTGKT